MDARRRIWSRFGSAVRSVVRRNTGAERPLRDWTDVELYRVWCASTTELLRALNAEQTTTATDARRHLLAEIERRHPVETARWLRSDAVLSGDPPRFLIT